MDFLVSQICGAVVSIAALLSMQFKNLKYVLIFQLICNVVGSLSYILLDGGLSGFGIYAVALTQTIVFFSIRLYNKKAPVYLAYLFSALFLLCSLLTYKSYNDIFPLIAAQTCAFAISQEKSSNYRVLMLFNGCIWTIYDINVQAYTMIISHVITAISAIVGIIRLDLNKQRR